MGLLLSAIINSIVGSLVVILAWYLGKSTVSNYQQNRDQKDKARNLIVLIDDLEHTLLDYGMSILISKLTNSKDL